MDRTTRLDPAGGAERRKSIPPPVILLFAIDLLLCLAYAVNHSLGEPSWTLTRLLYLGGESNIPTWYSSVQLFCVSLLFGLFAFRNVDRSPGRSWALLLFPLLLLAFSADEVARIHEWLGKRVDALLLPTGHRKDTFFGATGIWMLVVGGPVVAVFLYTIRSLRRYVSKAPGVFRKIVIGVVLFFAGALGVETLSNIAGRHAWAVVLVNVLEEGLEMAGATVLFWAGYDLLLAHGLTWTLDAVDREGDSEPPRPRRDG